MRAFAVEFLRFSATVWSRMWRWTLRKRRNFFITLGVAVLILVVVSTVFSSAPKPTITEATPTPTPTATTKYTEIKATPVAGGAPGSSGAPEKGNPASSSAGSIPTEPEVDRSSAESVARGWLTAYLSRPSDSWVDWEKWVEPYTMPKILAQVRGQAFHAPSVLEGKAPTTVTEIKVTDPEPDAETNTPIRWSHNLVVNVGAGDGSALAITYGLVLGNSDDGWVVTSVSEVAVSDK